MKLKKETIIFIKESNNLRVANERIFQRVTSFTGDWWDVKEVCNDVTDFFKENKSIEEGYGSTEQQLRSNRELMKALEIEGVGYSVSHALGGGNYREWKYDPNKGVIC